MALFVVLIEYNTKEGHCFYAVEHENELQLLSFVLSTTFGISEAKEMAQHLRALAALSQDLGLIPSTAVVGSQPPRTSVPRDPLPSSDFYGQ